MWQAITKAADPFLDSLTTEGLLVDLLHKGKSIGQSIGSCDAAHNVSLLVSHRARSKPSARCWDITNLPEYVGEIEEQAPYRA